MQKDSQLDYKLSCSVCLELFQDPRNLACHHTFCLKCVIKLSKNSKITCPICRHETDIKDASLLPKNYVVSDIAEFLLSTGFTMNNATQIQCDELHNTPADKFCESCKANFCRDCLQNKHATIKVFASHKLINPKRIENDAICPNHESEKFKFWCKTCKKLCCRDCLLLECKNHEYIDAAKMAMEAKGEQKVKLENAKEHYDRFMKNMEIFESGIKQQKENFQVISDQIEKEFAKVEKALEAKKKSLLLDASNIQTESLAKLEKVLEETTSKIEGYGVHKSLVELAESTANPIEFLRIKMKVDKFLDQIGKMDASETSTMKFEIPIAILEEIGKKLDGVELKTSKNYVLVNEVSAKGKKWTLSMSSQYNGPQNTYEALTDNNHSYTGVGTQSLPSQWIQASFDSKVLVKSVTLAGPNTMPGGWNHSHVNGCVLQYSDDGRNWKNHTVIQGILDGFPTAIILNPPVLSQYWRIYRDLGYAATATLIFQ